MQLLILLLAPLVDWVLAMNWILQQPAGVTRENQPKRRLVKLLKTGDVVGPYQNCRVDLLIITQAMNRHGRAEMTVRIVELT
jgi:hypothetical protein